MARSAAKRGLQNLQIWARWIVAGVLTALLAAYLIHIFLIPRDLPRFDDFIIYRNAGIQTLHHQSTYDPVPGWHGKIKYKYAPFLSLLFGLTISQLPLQLAEALSYVLNFALWILFVKLVSDCALKEGGKAKRKDSAWKRWGFFWLFFAIFGMALRDELKLGQINIIPLVILWAYFSRYGKKAVKGVKPFAPWLGGLLLSFAIQFKLYSMVALPFLFYRKEWKTIGFTAAWTLFFNLVVLAPFHGIAFTAHENLRWIVSLTESSAELIPWPDNTSILSIGLKWTHSMRLAQVLWALFIIGYLAYQYLIRDKDPIFNLAFMFCMILPITPIAWPYWILFSVPAFFLLLADELQVWKESFRKRDKTFAELLFAGLVGLCLMLLGNSETQGATGPHLFLTLMILGALLAKEHRITKRLA